MWHAPHPGSRALAALSFSLLLGACAYSVPEVNPTDIPRIRQELAADPENTDLMVQLGMGQFKTGDFTSALGSLQGAVDGGQRTGPAFLYLGMVHEELGDWASAGEVYNQFLSVGRSEELKQEVRNRLLLIAQNVLTQRSQAALAQESELLTSAPTPQSVAIFPFAFNSTDQNLEPLVYALADMMTTDFKVSNALVVLERAQIQSLLDEMALGEAGYSEPGTGARAGRLLQAEHVVQGVLTPIGEDISVSADILNVPSSSSAGQVDASAPLASLFDMEKDLVFRTIRDVLGVALTPAEEQAIRENRTENVLAFLAYGRGLQLKDQGQYAAAQQEFQQAEALDPSFEAAATQATESQSIGEAASTTTAQVATTAATTGETTQSSGTVAPPPAATAAVAAAATTSAAQTLAGASNAVSPSPTAQTIDLGTTAGSGTTTQATSDRSDAVQESQGSESVTTAAQAQIRIVIRRPGGGDE